MDELTVVLKTALGDEVVTVTVPKFALMPDVIVWGSRIFHCQKGEWREASAWFVDSGALI